MCMFEVESGRIGKIAGKNGGGGVRASEREGKEGWDKVKWAYYSQRRK
jgi:hypothetical protein